jgi:peroxiredoxin
MPKNMPTWLIVVLIFVIGFLAYGLLTNSTTEDQKPPAFSEQNGSDAAEANTTNNKDVQVAPDFTLTDLDGNSVSLADFKGKNIFLNFFATWCGSCRAEMPDLEQIFQNYQDDDFIVLAVNIGESPSKVEDYITANNFTFPVLLDQERTVAKTYKVSSIPMSFFINEDGVIEYKHLGLLDYEQMTVLVDRLLQ